jgi:hypothetical protein
VPTGESRRLAEDAHAGHLLAGGKQDVDETERKGGRSRPIGVKGQPLDARDDMVSGRLQARCVEAQGDVETLRVADDPLGRRGAGRGGRGEEK